MRGKRAIWSRFARPSTISPTAHNRCSPAWRNKEQELSAHLETVRQQAREASTNVEQIKQVERSSRALKDETETLKSSMEEDRSTIAGLAEQAGRLLAEVEADNPESCHTLDLIQRTLDALAVHPGRVYLGRRACRDIRGHSSIPDNPGSK